MLSSSITSHPEHTEALWGRMQSISVWGRGDKWIVWDDEEMSTLEFRCSCNIEVSQACWHLSCLISWRIWLRSAAHVIIPPFNPLEMNNANTSHKCYLQHLKKGKKYYFDGHNKNIHLSQKRLEIRLKQFSWWDSTSICPMQIIQNAILAVCFKERSICFPCLKPFVGFDAVIATTAAYPWLVGSWCYWNILNKITKSIR